MFSYFKNKQQEKPQSVNNQGMLRLPSNIISQLVNQNNNNNSQVISQKKLHITQAANKGQVYLQNEKTEQKGNKVNKTNTKSDSMIDIDHITKTQSNKSDQVNNEGIINNSNLVKSERLLQNVNTNNSTHKLEHYQQPQQKHPTLSQQSPKQQILKPQITSALSLKLSNLSTQDLQQLTSLLIDILTQTISSQLLGTPLSPQHTLALHKSLTPSTISTISQLNSHHYQHFLLQTKQKYNQLVDQSTNLFSKSRQIADYIHQFLLSINLFFQSQQLLVPVEQIHKGICELNPAKTEKYINYLIKIFQSNFDQVIQKKMQIIKLSLQTQLRKIQKQNKQLQNEIKRLNEQFKAKETIYLSSQSKVDERQSLILNLRKQLQQLNNKLSQVSSLNKQSKQDYNSQLLLLKRQLQRSKKQSQQHQQKLNKLQKTIQKRDKLIKTKQQEISRLQLAIKQLKQTQNQGVQKIVEEIQMKEKAFNTKIEQFSIEKINLQGKIRLLGVDNSSLKESNCELKVECDGLRKQVQRLKDQLEEFSKIKNSSSEQNDDQNHTQHIDNYPTQTQSQQPQQSYQNQHNQIDLSKLVNKQIMAHLFLSFEDESKQWAIRNNIKNQIYILLDIKQKQLEKDKVNYQIKNPQQNEVQKQQTTKKVNTNSQPSIIGKWLGW